MPSFRTCHRVIPVTSLFDLYSRYAFDCGRNPESTSNIQQYWRSSFNKKIWLMNAYLLNTAGEVNYNLLLGISAPFADRTQKNFRELTGLENWLLAYTYSVEAAIL